MYHLINPAYIRSTPEPIFRFGDVSRTTNHLDPATWAFFDFNDPRVASLDFSDLAGSMISVVAVGPHGSISAYSNRCGAVALWCLAAPGGDTRAGGPETDGIWSTHPDPANGYYVYYDGTSMAAPVAAGAAAVLREAFPYMTARQIIEIMLTTANSGGIYANASIYGRGLLDLGRAPSKAGASWTF